MSQGGFTFPGYTGCITPIFGYYGPTSKLDQRLINQQGTFCEDFEMNFYRCVEAFGLSASKRKCDLEYRDLLECTFYKKQASRFYAMHRERMKQFLEGKRDRPYMKNPPSYYIARGDWYDHVNIKILRATV